MLNKTATIHSLTQDFLKAVLPHVKGPNGEKIMKRDGHADTKRTDEELKQHNPIGIYQAAGLLMSRIQEYAEQNGIEDKAAFVLLAQQTSPFFKEWPEITSYTDLTTFLENRREKTTKISRHAADAMTIAHNNIGLDAIW